MLIWDQRLVHGEALNDSDRLRMAQFIKGFHTRRRCILLLSYKLQSSENSQKRKKKRFLKFDSSSADETISFSYDPTCTEIKMFFGCVSMTHR